MLNLATRKSALVKIPAFPEASTHKCQALYLKLQQNEDILSSGPETNRTRFLSAQMLRTFKISVKTSS